MIDFAKITGFDWNESNFRKNTEKHEVIQSEAEQIFFNQPLLVLEDLNHSQKEARYHAMGTTDDGRELHVAFTLRSHDTLIRVISARDMHRKERKIYEQSKS